MSATPERPDPDWRLPRWGVAACVFGPMLLHAVLLARPGLLGGADMLPHLRLIQQMGEAPGLHSVYAPAYHVLGAWLAPLVGLLSFPKVFALLSVPALLASFRFFQRSAGLPDSALAVYACTPYFLLFSTCMPKVEAAGYALMLIALGFLLRGWRVALALTLAAAFWVHTASAILIGFSAGVLALARRDVRALAALAAGTALALPLAWMHVLDGCSWGQALMLSRDDYLRASGDSISLQIWREILLLSSPWALAIAAAGAGPLWRTGRALAWMCVAMLALYTSEIWLAPFPMRLSLDLFRGLSLLAIPVAIAGGLALAAHPSWRAPALLVLALYLAGSALSVAPNACFVRERTLADLEHLEVDRCTFRWKMPRRPRASEAAQRRSAQRAAGERSP